MLSVKVESELRQQTKRMPVKILKVVFGKHHKSATLPFLCGKVHNFFLVFVGQNVILESHHNKSWINLFNVIQTLLTMIIKNRKILLDI